MPNVGRPSRDCHLCRQRRVKCDLLRPECSRCTRLGKKCPGYRDESLVFRVESQSTFVQNATQDRRRRRPDEAATRTCSRSGSPASASSDPGKKISSRPSPDSIDAKQGESPLSEGAITSIDQYEVARYLGSASQSPPVALADNSDSRLLSLFMSRICSRVNQQAAVGFLSFLPPMVTKAANSTEESGLVSTCRAIAYAFIANDYGTPESRSRRSLAYGKALQITNAALDDTIARVKDETLVSIWLLSMYELIAGLETTVERNGPILWNTHLRGLVTLLKIRGTKCLHTPAERSIFWLLYNSVQIRSFVLGVECPPESLEWFLELSKDLRYGEYYAYHVTRFGYDASALCAKIREVVMGGPGNTSTSPLELLSSAEYLADATADLLVPRISTFAFPKLGYPGMIKDFGTISFRTFYCAFRMKLHAALCQLLTTEHIHNLGLEIIRLKYQTHVATVQSLADEILAVGSVLLPVDPSDQPSSWAGSPPAGKPERTRFWTDGLRVLWPFRQVVWNKIARPDQKAQAFETLQHLHNALGFPHAPDSPPPWAH